MTTAIRTLAVALVLVGCSQPIGDAERAAEVQRLYDKSRLQYPEVPDVSVEELLRWQAEGDVVLVDAREAEEREVSTLPGALSLAELRARKDELEGRRVVTYCTIGARSGQAARELLREGWNASNLAGSILAWTHAGGELVDASGPTRRVHVFGPPWNLVAEGYDAVW